MGTGKFVTGGMVQAGGGRYFERAVDQELLRLCRDGQVGIVLDGCQMGKSSLLTNAANQLKQEGFRAIVVDLMNMGTTATQEQWYLALLTDITEMLGLSDDFDPVNWWDQRIRFPVAYRWVLFCREMLELVVGRIVIFIDEINTTLSLDFADEFFAAIRAMTRARRHNHRLARLTFVFAGLQQPNARAEVSAKSPFNLGERVEILDFTLEEAFQFLQLFNVDERYGRAVIEAIHGWTSGHPYLTQKLCSAVESRLAEKRPPHELVDDVVHETLMGSAADRDSNLLYVREMLTRRATRGDEDQILCTYRDIFSAGRIPDNAESPVLEHLKRSGVVSADQGYLRVRNRIYGEVFGRPPVSPAAFHAQRPG